MHSSSLCWYSPSMRKNVPETRKGIDQKLIEGERDMFFQRKQEAMGLSKFLREKSLYVGRRTLKTAVAVILSMGLVMLGGNDTSRVIFAMLGAMAAMEHTFQESVEACLTQFVGMFLGAFVGIALRSLPFYPLISVGMGIVLVIILYNGMHIPYSPTLPCLIVVIMCMTPDIQPLDYAFGRLWASGIGLGTGLLINILVFPYDNSGRIRRLMRCLDQEILLFLNKMFDSTQEMPDTAGIVEMQTELRQQLKIFSQQTILLHKDQKKRTLRNYEASADIIRKILAQLEVLLSLCTPGKLNTDNRAYLISCGLEGLAEKKSSEKGGDRTPQEREEACDGAPQEREEACDRVPQEMRETADSAEADWITNYTVGQIMQLRRQWLELLDEQDQDKKTDKM